jgi:acyl-CoA synthetase (AMP-forming)/AMP-acid ligase II
LVQGPDTGSDWARRLDRHGDAAALIAADGAITSYRQFLASADTFAAQLAQAAAGRRLLVALLARNDIASIEAYVGCLRGGHPVILLDADGDTARIIADFAPDIVACPAENRFIVRPAVPGAALHPDLALLLSTSGSTGSPKLVRLSAGAVAANAAAIIDYLGIRADDRAITTLAIHYSFGMSVLNSHLMAGAAIIVTDLSVTHPDFAALLADLRPTSLSGVPYIYELLERTGLEDRLPDSIRTLTQAGGRLPAAKVRALAERGARQGFRFFAMYGQTEAAPRMAWLPPERAAEYPDCIGQAIPGGDFALIDESGAPIIAAETPGELVYRGPNLMMGYAVSRAELALGAELTELRTGDIAVRNAAGLYRIVGRASRFAKIAGLRIGFDDIEVLLRDAGHEALVSGDDALVTAHVEAVAGPEARDRLRALIAERAHIPEAAIAIVSGPVPRLTSGKVDYVAIRRAGAAQAATQAAAAAIGVHPILAGFRQAFSRPGLGRHESFQSLGGDSLSYVNAAITVEKAIGRLPAQWEEMPISALVALATVGPVARDDKAGWSRIGTETLIRLLALALVICGHAAAADTEFLRGGATILFLMAGYNIARFQKTAFEAGRTGTAVAGALERMILPYFALMIPILLASNAAKSWGWFGLVSVFTVDDAQRGPLFAFWFIETVFHALIVTILLFRVPPLRRLSRSRPFGFGMLMLALAMAAKILVPLYLFDNSNPKSLTIDAQYYLYALGWLAMVARSGWQKAVVLGLAVVLVGLDHGWLSSRQVWLGLALAALLAIPSLPMPRRLAPPVLRIAAAGYFIYVSHIPMNQIVRFVLHVDGPPLLNVALLLPLSVAGGLLFELVWSRSMGLVAATARSMRQWGPVSGR